MSPTIHTYSKEWKNAEVIGTGKDSLIGEKDVLIVKHPDFNDPLDFYAQADEQGKHFNVGNRAFWLTEE